MTMLTEAQATVLRALRQRQMTRWEIHEATGLRVSTVCGRVPELIEKGRIEPCGKKLDPNTGINVGVLRVKKKTRRKRNEINP